jgi:hypothetical protein
MKTKFAVIALLAFFVLNASAGAINGRRAVRQMRAYVDEDCNSPEARRIGYRCLGWDVYHCYELGGRKVRCKVYEEYEHNAHRRTCYFKSTAVETYGARGGFVFNNSRVQCFDESL